MVPSVSRAKTTIQPSRIRMALTAFLATILIKVRHTGTDPSAINAQNICQHGTVLIAYHVLTIIKAHRTGTVQSAWSNVLKTGHIGMSMSVFTRALRISPIGMALIASLATTTIQRSRTGTEWNAPNALKIRQSGQALSACRAKIITAIV